MGVFWSGWREGNGERERWECGWWCVGGEGNGIYVCVCLWMEVYVEEEGPGMVDKLM